MERRGSGIFLSDVRISPAVAVANRGEIAHFHASDCSGHVTISHADSIEVIQKGWGERHGLSGGLLPLDGKWLIADPTIEVDEVNRRDDTRRPIPMMRSSWTNLGRHEAIDHAACPGDMLEI